MSPIFFTSISEILGIFLFVIIARFLFSALGIGNRISFQNIVLWWANPLNRMKIFTVVLLVLGGALSFYNFLINSKVIKAPETQEDIIWNSMIEESKKESKN